MKACTRCKHDFEENEFPIINYATGKRSSMCPECKKVYDREHYAKHKVTRKKRKREIGDQQRKRNIRYVIEYLKKHPCVDCGEKDILVLEFDHKKNKDRCVSDIVNRGSSLEK